MEKTKIHKETEYRLRKACLQIEASIEKIKSTQGYTESCAKLKLLEELIKEQLPHENFNHSVGSIR